MCVHVGIGDGITIHCTTMISHQLYCWFYYNCSKGRRYLHYHSYKISQISYLRSYILIGFLYGYLPYMANIYITSKYTNFRTKTFYFLAEYPDINQKLKRHDLYIRQGTFHTTIMFAITFTNILSYYRLPKYAIWSWFWMSLYCNKIHLLILIIDGKTNIFVQFTFVYTTVIENYRLK